MSAPSRIRLPFAAVVLAMLPPVLDQTVLATGLPTIARSLGRIADLPWVVTAYVVAAAAAGPLWGKLGDRHGRKPVLELALAGFLAASAACAVAQDLTMLIAARAVQGAAAGGLMGLAMAAVGDLVAPRERGRYQGYIAAVFAVATVAGPLIGGVLVEHVGWRWVFLVNLPLGLLALAGLHRHLPAPVLERSGAPFDVAGAALLAGATTAGMLACVWNAAPVPALLATAALLGVAFVLRERRAPDPVVPLDLLTHPVVAVSSAALFLATGALFAVNVFVPLFLQATTGATPTQAGLLLMPMMLGIAASTAYAGRAIERTGRYKRYPVAGLALMTVALTGLAVAVGHPSRVTIGAGLVVFGAGFGMVGQVLVTAVQNAVDRRRLGVAMATTGFFRAAGGATGAAVFGTVFAASADPLAGVQAVFTVAAPVAALGLLVTLLLREVPLQRATPAEPVRTTPSAAGAASPAPTAPRRGAR